MAFLTMRSASAFAGCAAVLAAASHAQCTGQWLDGQGVPGISGVVYASVMWDPDGAGPLPEVLVVGGSFTLADSTLANNIAYWNGTSWSALGAGLGTSGFSNSQLVQALTVYNGNLVAGGTFTKSGSTTLGSIARWTGSAWAPMNSGATIDFGSGGVNALVVASNGDLIAGGGFTTAGTNTTGTLTVNRIARWNGTAWSALNPSNSTNSNKGVSGSVNALAVDSSGGLVAGGNFTAAGTATTGTLTVNRVARWTWNGTDWVVSQLGSGLGASVNALATKSNGDIIAGGAFTTGVNAIAGQNATPAANFVIRWDAATSAWMPMDMGVGTDGTNDANVRALAVLSNGDVAAAGDFWTSNGAFVGGLARWNGSAWSSMWTKADPRSVTSLLSRADGSLVVGGTFKSASGVAANGAAVWNAGAWSGVTATPAATSAEVTELDPVPGGDVLAGGGFLSVEGVAARRVARISGGMGAGKTALGDGLFEHAEPFPSVVVNQNPPAPFAVLPGGDIVAGGIDFATADGGDRSVLARFNGGTWSHFTPDLLAADLYGPPYPPLGVVKSLVTLPSGDLLVGGLFFLDGDPFFHFLVRWDGTQWTDMGIISGAVEKMIVKPNGHVIIAGDFTAANGVLGADYICEWDGTSTFGDGTPEYTPLGQGADGPVNAIALLANGDLIAAGDFQNVGNTSPGDLQVNRIARWDGTSWSRLGSGLSNSAYALAVMPGGDVVVGGGFTASATISGETATPAMNRIGRWNGSAWSPLGTATVNGVGGAGLITNINIPTGSVYSLAVTSAGVLLVGGDFVTTDFDTAAPVSNGRPSAYLARWADCVGACCQSDGSCTVGAGSPSAVCAAGTLVPGGACSPNACPQPGGVCCRGATCNATVTQANCLGDGPAGALYVSASSVCNAGGSTATPCCYADYDKSGTIAVSDIFAFLNSWFAGSPFALVGGDGASGTLAVSHIFDFLNAWFAGGC